MRSCHDVDRHRIRRYLLIAAGIVSAVGFAYVVVVFLAVSSAASDSRAATAAATASGDAIVVLGAAQYDGEPSPVFARRLETAFELWEAGVAPIIVTTGANQPGDTFTEGFAGFRYLRSAGVAEDRIVVVVDGGDTFESLAAAANQLEGGARVVLVTDAYHSRRAFEVAEEVGFDATVVAAGDDTGLSRRFRETVAVSIGRIIGYRRLSSLR